MSSIGVRCRSSFPALLDGRIRTGGIEGIGGAFGSWLPLVQRTASWVARSDRLHRRRSYASSWCSESSTLNQSSTQAACPKNRSGVRSVLLLDIRVAETRRGGTSLALQLPDLEQNSSRSTRGASARKRFWAGCKGRAERRPHRAAASARRQRGGARATDRESIAGNRGPCWTSIPSIPSVESQSGRVGKLSGSRGAPSFPSVEPLEEACGQSR